MIEQDVLPNDPRRGSRARSWGPALAALVILLGMLGACRRDAEPPTRQPPPETVPSEVKGGLDDATRARMEEEFATSYPTHPPAATVTRSFEITAAPTTVPQFDGQPLDVWAYNGQVPGPVLRVRLGEQVAVTLTNNLPQPTTIHWHGVRVPNAMDGVPGVTQDPVPKGGTFTYTFTPKDAGTFWFHPHVRGSEQVERGLYGVLVVEDTKTLPYSRDEVWVLDDWKLGADGKIDPRFVTRHDLAHDGRWGQRITVNGDANAQMVVQPGERMRLRLVNTSNGRVYQPDFSGFDAKIIAFDGMYTSTPQPTDGLILAPGNRVDLDITVPTTARTLEVADRFTRRPHNLVTVRVEGETRPTPQFAMPSNPNIPTWRGLEGTEPDLTYVLDAKRGGPHGITWTINGVPWGEHEVTELKGGRFTLIRFQNSSSRLHPMHIHGQFFKVLARNGQPANEPFFRDTVLLTRKETVDVGMVPLDWGHWMMHCHILEHAESGMMTEIRVEE